MSASNRRVNLILWGVETDGNCDAGMYRCIEIAKKLLSEIGKVEKYRKRPFFLKKEK